MLLNVASVVLALQLGVPAHPLNDGEPPVQEIQYRVPVRPPPCGHGWMSVLARACAIRPALFTRGIKRRDSTAGIAATDTMATIHGRVAATTTTIEGPAIVWQMRHSRVETQDHHLGGS
jgi:hypothetical protein